MLLTDIEVQEAMDRKINPDEVRNMQMRLGLDVARGGVDRSAFARRQGLIAHPIEEESSSTLGPELAGLVMKKQEDFRVERVFVDNTGGFGSSVIDSLDMAATTMDVTPIHYSSKAQDKRYFNKRTEMWVRMRDWVRKGGQLPRDPDLAKQLTCPKLFFHGGVFRLEEKQQIKDRLGFSPDKADALAQTFADVEQPSFFANYEAQDRTGRPLDEEAQFRIFQQIGAGMNNHLSDPDQLDSGGNPFYPKHRS